MDDIEKMMIKYVQAGRAFACLWGALKLASDVDDLPDGMDIYVRRLKARQALPEEGEEIALWLPPQLRALRRATLAAKDAAHAASGERFALERKLSDLNEISRAWQMVSELKEALADRSGAMRLCTLWREGSVKGSSTKAS